MRPYAPTGVRSDDDDTNIQLFRERLSEKSAHDNPKRYCG